MGFKSLGVNFRRIFGPYQFPTLAIASSPHTTLDLLKQMLFKQQNLYVSSPVRTTEINMDFAGEMSLIPNWEFSGQDAQQQFVSKLRAFRL